MILRCYRAWKRTNALQVLTESVCASRRPIFLALQGIPGSGKSTVARRLAVMTDAVIVGLDAIRAELGNERDQSNNAMVVEIAKQRIDTTLRSGRHVILDSTLTNRAWLDDWLATIAPTGADVRILRVHVPLDVALTRNAQRERIVPEDAIRRMHSSLEQFNDQGLSSLITVIDNRSSSLCCSPCPVAGLVI